MRVRSLPAIFNRGMAIWWDGAGRRRQFLRFAICADGLSSFGDIHQKPGEGMRVRGAQEWHGGVVWSLRKRHTTRGLGTVDEFVQDFKTIA